MKIGYCNVEIHTYAEDDCGNEYPVPVKIYKHMRPVEAYKLMAEYTEKHPDGYWCEGDIGFFSYEEDGKVYSIIMDSHITEEP